MSKLFLRSQFNYDTMQASDECGLKCEDVSRAQQHQKEESDINTIVMRFGLTGELPSNVRMPQYGDFTGITDYQSALNAVKTAEMAFMTMPADIRSRFGNDPEKFVEFCLDDNNRAEAEKLGLVAPKSEPAPAGAGTPAADGGGKPV